jgi:hypothetical protein
MRKFGGPLEAKMNNAMIPMAPTRVVILKLHGETDERASGVRKINRGRDVFGS